MEFKNANNFISKKSFFISNFATNWTSIKNCLVKAFWILVSFRLSFIWLRSTVLYCLCKHKASKLKTKNNRLKQTSIQNA